MDNQELKKTALADCVEQKGRMQMKIKELEIDLKMVQAEVARQDSMIKQLVQQRNDDVMAFRKAGLGEHLRAWWNR